MNDNSAIETDPAIRRSGGALIIDLTMLETPDVQADAREAIENYVSAIQALRGAVNIETLTLRTSDVHALAAVLDREVPAFRDELVGAGVARAR